MNLVVETTKTVSGEFTPPSSKSHTIRGLMIATLANGRSVLRHALDSDDTRAAIEVCQALGAIVRREGDSLVVESTGVPLQPAGLSLYSDNSGITTNFVLPMIGLRQETNTPMMLDTGEQMRQRPVQPLIGALCDLGMNIEAQHGRPPLSVSGKLRGGKTSVDGLSSQYLSALLLSCPLAQEDTEIAVMNLCERSYVDMTLRWLDEQKIKYQHEHSGTVDRYWVKGNQHYHPFTKDIPTDFSSASYLIAAAVMADGEITLHGLDMNDRQPDKRIIEVLQEMGSSIENSELRTPNSELKTGGITVRGGNKLHGIHIDCNDMPDMVPTLAVIGTQARGKTEIVNVSHARTKETDRVHSMVDGLRRMGARVDERDDGLTVYQSHLIGAHVQGYHDHRTIMALAVAGLIAEGETVINTAEGITKTFPNFVEVMQGLGAKMTIS